MARLNGWRRIGIIVSVVSILGAGLWTFDASSRRDMNAIHSIEMTECETLATDKAILDCDDGWDTYLAHQYPSEWLESAFVAFIPVPLGWGFVYLILFLTAWVKRGFTRAI